MAINERLKAVRNFLGLSQRSFSKSIFLRQGSYCRIEQGLTKVNERIIEVVCSIYKVNKAFLKDGTGEMFSEPPPNAKLENFHHIFNELNELFQNYLIIQAKELLKVQNQQEEQK